VEPPTPLPGTPAGKAAAFLRLAETGVGRTREHIAAAAAALAAAADVPRARAAVEDARVAARETAAGVAGAGHHLAALTAAVRDRPAAAGGAAAVAVGLAVAAWLAWPAAAGAGASGRPDPGAAEGRAVKLIAAGEYDAARRLIDLELDTPAGWHLRGEIALGRGDERQARWWYQRAAEAGYRDSALVLTALDRKRSRHTE
jgi:hypothetical protein